MADVKGVIGAGLMGAEIALVYALAGRSVLLNDRDQASLDKAMSRLETLLQKGVSRGFYEPQTVSQALARITPTLDFDAMAEADFVTEAVFEDEELTRWPSAFFTAIES